MNRWGCGALGKQFSNFENIGIIPGLKKKKILSLSSHSLSDLIIMVYELLFAGHFAVKIGLDTITFPFWRRHWQPTPVLLPGNSHGWRSLVGCSPRGREESDTTERLHFHFSLSCIGEGNGNPLQCSCLENPRDRGTWWAAVYGVTQSRTQLKWLSSSSRKTNPIRK